MLALHSCILFMFICSKGQYSLWLPNLFFSTAAGISNTLELHYHVQETKFKVILFELYDFSMYHVLFIYLRFIKPVQKRISLEVCDV